MRRRRFKLHHSIVGTVALLLLESALGVFVQDSFVQEWGIVTIALLGGAGIIYVAMEAIEEVRNARHMLIMLSVVVFEFVVFFAFQYWYISLVVPGIFDGLTLDPVTLLLHSTMIFAFNPLYLATTLSGRTLMLVQTLESMALVIFVLQNIWQFRASDA